MAMKYDCIIVGGGIGGGVLALALGKKGRKVLVLERSKETPRTTNRPEVLSSYTLNFFNTLGIGEQIYAEAAHPLSGIRLSHPAMGLLIELSQDDFKANHVQPHFTDPAKTRYILIEQACAQTDVELRHSVEVKNLIYIKNKAVGVKALQEGKEVEFHAPIIIGDDGGNSLIRQQSGIKLQTQELPIVFVTAAGPMLPTMKPNLGEAWLQPSQLNKSILGGVFMPLPGNRSAIVFLMKQSHFEKYKQDPTTFYKEALNLSPLCKNLEQQFKSPNDFFMIHRPFGHASSYVAEGVAIMGDAAHPVTPVGGQGANASVSDAMVLWKVIDSALNENNFSAKRLSEYEILRRPANARSLKFSQRANTNFRLIGTFPFLEQLILPLIKKVNTNQKLKNKFIQAVSKTFLSYP